ncbi:uncharacterized protein LOC122718174 [Apis laboriosa]|uniref:uncharacterized protein LOC122718174 n=1 Tax=Apis laboriosa TaxID=183418 RepID=UPI001CC6F3C1|nr:uncharacterized protein LOC122718174 [Apis laboriosa]
MQQKKYERISRRITVLTLFHQIYFGRVIKLFTLVFDGFQKTQSHHCLSTVPYCYLGVEPETDTGFLTTFRHQTGLLPADLEERDGMWAWQVRKFSENFKEKEVDPLLDHFQWNFTPEYRDIFQKFIR